jgi:hypothetical protein
MAKYLPGIACPDAPNFWTFHVLVVISEVVAFSPATQAQRQ